MKFHRDAAQTIAPEAMAYYQTPATAPSTWRADLARIGVVCGVVFVAGAFATGTAVIFWRSWQTVGVGLWLTALLTLAPLAVYAVRTYNDVSARHNLDLARMYAEHEALLTSKLDVDEDGAVKDAEIDRFVEYARRLHRGEPTTAAHAQQACGIAGPDWQDYRDALIGYGYAHPVGRRGGKGFALKPSVLRTPWPKLERAMRERVKLGLGLAAEGRTFDADAVSTLGRD